MRVNNRSVIRQLTWRHLKSKRFRNIMAVAAITLTSILFTSIATLGGAMFQAIEENTFRQVGTSAHGGYKYLDEEEYQALVAAGGYEDISYDIIMGFATNPELRRKQHELRYAEDKKARWAFSYPTVGRMPVAYKEIAVSTLTLDLMGLPYELGQTIHLDFEVGSRRYSDEFILSGYWPGDEVNRATQCYLNRDYVRGHAPDPGRERAPGEYIGTVSADVWFKNAINVESRLNDQVKAAGLDPEQIETAVNWAYTSSNDMDPENILMAAAVVLLIMISGYLIIYGIFSISIAGDIRFYGLLKTIGTTSRQIRGVVLGQALILSAIGIPAGMLLGFILGKVMVPVMMGMLVYDTPTEIGANPLIFLFAAVFSLVTVFISCRKPGRRAAKVSPIEALGYAEGKTRNRRQGREKSKKTKKVTMLSMAWNNIKRVPGKLIVVLLSLSLSLVLLNCVISVVQGFNMDAYLADRLRSDLYFTDEMVMNASTLAGRNYAAIPPELEAEVKNVPGLEASGQIYYRNYEHYFPSEAVKQRFDDIFRPHMDKEYEPAELERLYSEGYALIQCYGIDRLAFEQLEENRQEIDWEKFSSGKYVLLEMESHDGQQLEPLYQIGDKIPLQGDDGTVSDYEVLGYMTYPRALGSQFSNLFNINMVIPAAEFTALFPGQQPFSLMIDVEDSYIEAAEQWAKAEVAAQSGQLVYLSRSFFAAEYRNMQYTFLILGGVLAGVLALIGILNFINAMTTSVMTRKRELAMLQSVGMTSVQLKQMLFFEGLWYAILTSAVSLILSVVLMAGVIRRIAGALWFFEYRLTLLPLLICIPVLFIICAAVPGGCRKYLYRESVVERLREE